ncbi:MAG: holo-ACP synthase [Simkaniaceae bacterium]|nr:holo-ACP synthase [Simkaniaceae bacterium]
MTNNIPIDLGIDIVDIERIRQSVKKYSDRFLNRIFTAEELSYCMGRPDPIIHLAVRFAAKEAVSKALGTGIGEHLGWKDISIKRGTLGKPSVIFSEKANLFHGNPIIILSLSHTDTIAIASAIRTN